MTVPLPVAAVLFDLDGTLVDDSRSYREATRLTAERLLGTPVSPAEVATIKGYPGFNNDWYATWALLRVRNGQKARPPDSREQSSAEYRILLDTFQTIYLGSARWQALSGLQPPFAWETGLMERETSLLGASAAAALRSFRTGIATSRPRAEALIALQRHDFGGLFTPETLVALEDAAAEKPDPAPLRLLLDRLGGGPAVYVGDTVNDALAAEAAGMAAVWVGPLEPPPGTPLLARIAGVNDLPPLLTPIGVA